MNSSISTLPALSSLHTQSHSGVIPCARYSFVQSLRLCFTKFRLGTATIIFLTSIACAIQNAVRLLPVAQGIISLPLDFAFFTKYFFERFIALSWWGLGFLFTSFIGLCLQKFLIFFHSSALRLSHLSRPISEMFPRNFLFRIGLLEECETIPREIFFALTKLKVEKVESSLYVRELLVDLNLHWTVQYSFLLVLAIKSTPKSSAGRFSFFNTFLGTSWLSQTLLKIDWYSGIVNKYAWVNLSNTSPLNFWVNLLLVLRSLYKSSHEACFDIRRSIILISIKRNDAIENYLNKMHKLWT